MSTRPTPAWSARAGTGTTGPRSPRLSEAVAPDPVGAVLDAHERGDLLRLRTSGTTGGPRVVLRTTTSWFDSFEHYTRLTGLGKGARLWLPGPLTATMNLFAAVHARVVGAALTTTPRAPTHAVLTPAALARAVAQELPLAGVHVVVAGDRLGRRERDVALDAGAAVSHYYGAAELSFVAWGSHAEDLRPFPGVEIAAEDGVLWVRSPYVFEGYDGPDGPAVTREDGFTTVGDRGELVGGGVRVTGRGTEAVVTAGATVLVADVEAALETATGHRPVVVGLPHPDLGAVVCAVATSTEALAALRKAAPTVLDEAQRPRRWHVDPTPPLTPAGKVDRAALADRVRRTVEARTPPRRTVDTP